MYKSSIVRWHHIKASGCRHRINTSVFNNLAASGTDGLVTTPADDEEPPEDQEPTEVEFDYSTPVSDEMEQAEILAGCGGVRRRRGRWLAAVGSSLCLPV
jgi:hypothetical protein